MIGQRFFGFNAMQVMIVQRFFHFAPEASDDWATFLGLRICFNPKKQSEITLSNRFILTYHSILLPKLSSTHPGGIFEEAAEGCLVFKAEHAGYFLRAFGGVEKQALGFGLDAVVDDADGRGLPVGGKQVGKRFGRTVEQVGIFLHLLLLPEMGVDKDVKLADRFKLHTVFAAHAVAVFGYSRT